MRSTEEIMNYLNFRVDELYKTLQLLENTSKVTALSKQSYGDLLCELHDLIEYVKSE